MGRKSAVPVIAVVAALAIQAPASEQSPYPFGFYGADRTFTDLSAYNSIDFAGSPLGLLEIPIPLVSLSAGFGRRSWESAGHGVSGDGGVNSFDLPRLRVGAPGIICMEAGYYPQNAETDTFRLPLRRFGLTIAGGVPGGWFRMAVSASGILGELEQTGTQDHRSVMGAENVGLYIGTQIHPLVRLGAHVAADGVFDSLHRTVYVEDREFIGSIPRIGGDIGFGDSSLPVLAGFSLDAAKRRFIYATAPATLQNRPIMSDSRTTGKTPRLFPVPARNTHDRAISFPAAACLIYFYGL